MNIAPRPALQMEMIREEYRAWLPVTAPSLCPSSLSPARASFCLNAAGPAPELLVLKDSGRHTHRPALVGSISGLLSAKQVMKMIMTLNVQESGRVKYIKRPGAVLEAGCVVARLELDDPSKVHPVRSARHGHPAGSGGLGCAHGLHLPGQ